MLLLTDRDLSPTPQSLLKFKETMSQVIGIREHWDSYQVSFAIDLIERSYRLRRCPYNFVDTCAEILADLKPWPDSKTQSTTFIGIFAIDMMRNAIPDPEAIAPPLGKEIHDLDRATKVVLQLLPFMPMGVDLSRLYRYISRRHRTVWPDALACILDSSTHEPLQSRIVQDLQANNTHSPYLDDTIWLLFHNRIQQDSPPSLSLQQATQLYPDHCDRPIISATTMAMVRHHILLGLEMELSRYNPNASYHISVGLQEERSIPDSSREDVSLSASIFADLEKIYNHPLLFAYHPNRAPYDPSISVAEVCKTVGNQAKEIRFICLSQILAAYGERDGSPYIDRGFDTVWNLCFHHSHNFDDGSFSIDTQRGFANAVRTGVHCLITDPTADKFELGHSLAEVWDMADKQCSEWLTDVTSASILAEAVAAFRAQGAAFRAQGLYEGMNFAADDINVPTRALLERCSYIIKTDAANSMDLLTHLPNFDRSQNSRQDVTEVRATDTTFFGVAKDSASEARANEHLRDFLCPAFP